MLLNFTTGEQATEEIPEQRLWRAVLAKTVEDWVSGPLRHSREAENYLFDDQKDFRAVCQSAGIDPEGFRARLVRMRQNGLGPSRPAVTLLPAA